MTHKKRKKKIGIVSRYAKMWSRDVFYVKTKAGNQYNQDVKKLLSQPGVYVLYRDDHPYYVGKASKKLFNRLRDHAVKPKDKYYNFWNFFSAFVVKRTSHIPEVEGILIAAMPTDNSVVPRIHKIHIPLTLAKFMMARRTIAMTENRDDR